MTSARIDDAAAEWVAREDAGALDAGQRAAMEHWLAADLRHAGAYARARALLVAAGHGAPVAVPRPVHHPAMSRRMAIAAVLSMAAAGLLFLGMRAWDQGSPRYETALGELRRLPLDDGSVLTLNTASRVQVEMTDDLRRVRLIEGEALFDVASDPARPFVVEAGDTRVRAVGTSFSVSRAERDTLQVLVREGRVRIERAGAAPVPVSAGMQAAVDAGGTHVQPLQAAQVHQRLAWREGMLAFDGDTLAEASADFARYSDTRILIADPQVAGMRVVGLYSATDPKGFAQAVALSLGLVVEEDRDGVHLRPSATEPSRP